MATKARVVICDDGDDLRETLAEFIVMQGHEVETAPDARGFAGSCPR
jgi:DNA-binding response OmpR family regulator